VNIILNVEPIRFPLTGIGRYTYELASALQASNEISNLEFFAVTRFLSALPQPASQGDTAHGVRRFLQKSAFAMETYRLLMPALRARALKGKGEYIYHRVIVKSGVRHQAAFLSD
jgi:alpha-1,3-rhamnosyl/mannosyltransferase